MRDNPLKVAVDHPLGGTSISEDEDSNAAFAASTAEEEAERFRNTCKLNPIESNFSEEGS